MENDNFMFKAIVGRQPGWGPIEKRFPVNNGGAATVSVV
jgi:hypothetical protein